MHCICVTPHKLMHIFKIYSVRIYNITTKHVIARLSCIDSKDQGLQIRSLFVSSILHQIINSVGSDTFKLQCVYADGICISNFQPFLLLHFCFVCFLSFYVFFVLFFILFCLFCFLFCLFESFLLCSVFLFFRWFW